jgi:hypothetical protein
VQKIEKKGLERTFIDGCIRLIIAANSDEALNLGPHELADARAIGERIIRLNITPDRTADCVRAADRIREDGCLDRLDTALIASHIMWMWENVPLSTRSDRWIVEPYSDCTQQMLEGHAGAHEELWDYIEAEVRGAIDGRQLTGGVYVRPEGLVIKPIELAEYLSHKAADRARDALRPFTTVESRRYHWKMTGRTNNGWLLLTEHLPSGVRALVNDFEGLPITNGSGVNTGTK